MKKLSRTTRAIRRVVSPYEGAEKARHVSRQIVVLATLDVKTAFNSSRKVDTLRALTDDFRVRVLSDYLHNISLTYDMTDGPKTKYKTTGVAQGSILVRNLRNISYNKLLRLEMPFNAFS